MLIVDAQIHLWKNNKPTNFANHRQIPDYTAEDALREMDAGGSTRPSSIRRAGTRIPTR